MDNLNMICCPITPAVINNYMELVTEENITPLKMYKEGTGMVGLAFIRGVKLLGTILAVPFQGQDSKLYLVLWVSDEITTEEVRKYTIQRMINEIVMLLPRRDIIISGDTDADMGLLVKAVEDSYLFKISYKQNGFYAICKGDKEDYEDRVNEAGSSPTFEGCQAGIEATWSPYVISPRGPNMVNSALKEFIMNHSDDFNAIYDYALSKGKYAYSPLKYDLLVILDEYSTYFSDLSTYIVSILRPSNTQVNCDDGDKITKAVDIDSHFRKKLFEDHEITSKHPLLVDSVEQLNAFIKLSSFLDTVSTTFSNIPHLDSKCASSMAAIINVYGYSVTEFLKRFCKELMIEFNAVIDCVKGNFDGNLEKKDFILI